MRSGHYYYFPPVLIDIRFVTGAYRQQDPGVPPDQAVGGTLQAGRPHGHHQQPGDESLWPLPRLGSMGRKGRFLDSLCNQALMSKVKVKKMYFFLLQAQHFIYMVSRAE
jgi:hypothetical protein